MRRSRPACWPPRPPSTPSSAGRQHDELTRLPGGLREQLAARGARPVRATSSSGSRRAARSRTLMTGIEQWLLPKLGIKAPPWTLHRTAADHAYLKPAAECAQIAYPKPDGKLTFDRLSSVFISNTNHEENQPAHLTLKDASVPVAINLREVRRPREPLLPGRRLRVRQERRRQRPAADQRAELRALQDLRHQGPDAEHRLGHARRRRRAELRGM